jgi:hypothetical protein
MKLKLANCERVLGWVSQEFNPSYKADPVIRDLLLFTMAGKAAPSNWARNRAARFPCSARHLQEFHRCLRTHRPSKSITTVICKFVVSTKPDQAPRLFADSLFFQ